MEEFCGYKSLDGRLHEKEESCRKADLEYKINIVKQKFSVLDHFITKKIYEHYRYSQGKDYIPNHFIEETLIYIFANYKKELLDIYRESKLIQKELDELHEEYKKSSWSRNWWLKFKWWK